MNTRTDQSCGSRYDPFDIQHPRKRGTGAGHHPYLQGNGPWEIFPIDHKREWHELPKDLHASDSDRIGYNYLSFGTTAQFELAERLLVEKCGAKNPEITCVWQCNNASSGFPVFTFLYREKKDK